MLNSSQKNKLLLHICCIGCGAYVSQILAEKYDIELFFYNPNIFPPNEYEKRRDETKRIADAFKLKLHTGEYDHKVWLKKIAGYENEPERGRRCEICYQDRIAETAKRAKTLGINLIATTLTISPHKNAQTIFQIGEEIANKNKLQFLKQDFKKQGGFSKAAKLSKELNLYRQNYCGCEFSIRYLICV